MKPLKESIFEKKDNGINLNFGVIDEGLREDEGEIVFTRTKEEKYYEGTPTVALLSSAFVWGLIASILVWCEATGGAYFAGGVATLCVLIWVVFYVIPAIWKWFLSLVE